MSDQELAIKLLPIILQFLQGNMYKTEFIKQLILAEPSFVDLITIFKETLPPTSS